MTEWNMNSSFDLRSRVWERSKKAGTGARHNALPLVFCLLVLIVYAPASVLAGKAGEQRYLAGQFLVSTPGMRDPRFVETVIYMVKHDTAGAFGLIINRPLASGPIKTFLKGFGMERDEAKGEIIVHYGGPVARNSGFVLHSDDYLLGTSAVIKDGIAMTSDPKLIEAIVDGQGPRHWLLMFGYSGWGPGQLEKEIEAQSWFTIPADRSLLFGDNAEKKWRVATDRRKIEL